MNQLAVALKANGSARNKLVSKVIRKPLVLSVLSLEGGSGKTSLSTNLGYLAWRFFGLKTLIIDLDQNCSLANFTGIEPPSHTESTVYTLFQENFEGEWPLVSVFDSDGGVCIVPGYDSLSGEMISARISRELILLGALRNGLPDFDLVILDNRDGFDAISHNAIRASTHLVVTSKVGGKSLDVGDAISKIDKAKRSLLMEVEPKLLGIVLNEADKADTDSQVLEGVVGTLSEIGINVYDPIPRSGWLKRSSALGQPLAQIRPSDEINNTFRKILTDLISTNA